MVQTFTRNTVPTKVGVLTVQLTSVPALDKPAGTNPQGGTQQTPPTGRFYLQLLDTDDNEVRIVSGDLVPYLTPAQAQGLVDLMQALRTKAVTEAL